MVLCMDTPPAGGLLARINAHQVPACLGCEQGPHHRHNEAEDGPRATCCAHTCPPIKRYRTAKDMTGQAY